MSISSFTVHDIKLSEALMQLITQSKPNNEISFIPEN